MALWYSIVITTILIIVEPVSCLTCLSCQCGSSSKNYRHCIQNETKEEYTCNNWAYCQTCKENITYCITCPPKQFGPHCTQGAVEPRREKRQINPGRSTHCENEGSIHNGRVTVIRASTQPLLFEEEDFELPVGTRLHYSCEVGYVLKGTAELVCEDQGYWSEEKPYCVEDSSTECPDPDQISFGSYRDGAGDSGTSQRFAVGHWIIYSCQNGYEIVGSREVTCLPTGSWSSKPSCRRTTETPIPLESPGTSENCRDPGSISNGYRRLTSGVASRTRTFNHGQTLRYFCNQGYELQGNNELTCLTSGQWSSNTPRCSETNPTFNCPDPGSIQNGFRRSIIDLASTVPGTFSEGQSFRYFCDYGYELRGNSMLTCLPSGMWSSSRPSCQEVVDLKRRKRQVKSFGSTTCMNEGPIDNGRVHVRRVLTAPLQYADEYEFPVGTRLRYSCNEGYVLKGDADLICEDSGYWSEEKPICKEIKSFSSTYCMNEGPIDNGRVHVIRVLTAPLQYELDEYEFPVGTRLRYSCDEGYVLKGEAGLICEDSGYWSEEKPICIENVIDLKRRKRQARSFGSTHCMNEGPIHNGRVHVRRVLTAPLKYVDDFEFPVGTRLRYSCDEGYVLKGDADQICEDSGYWSEEKPICIEIKCQMFGPVLNGRVVVYFTSMYKRRKTIGEDRGLNYPFGTSISYICNKGYQLRGDKTLYCKSTGKWSANEPVCTKREVGRIRRHRQRRIKGIRRRRQISKSYNSSHCENEGPVDNGRVAVLGLTAPRRSVEDDFEFPVGTVLSYRCDKGFVLQGAAYLVCTDTGYWTEVKPTCIEMKCKKFGPVSNGRVVVQFTSKTKLRKTIHEENGLNYPVGTSLRYECDNGYIVDGNKTLFCDSTGKWSSDEPLCTKECGVNSIDSNRTVFLGTKTKPGEWPWTVAITIKENSTTKFLCSGVLIDSKTVLTVAHCVQETRDYELYFGLFQLNFEIQSESTSTTTSSRIIVHPGFNKNTLQNDIALIIFEPPIVYTENIQPICLPRTKKVLRGEKGFLSGWETRKHPSPLQEMSMIHVSVLSRKSCKQHYSNIAMTLNNARSTFCAGHVEDIDNFGFMVSGSPIVFYNAQPDSYTLEGLVSKIEGPPFQGRKKRYVLTRVATFMPWILANWKK